MPKITHNDLPAAVEAIMLRIDILHDLVKATKDAVDKLLNEQAKTMENDEKKELPGSKDTIVNQGEELLDIKNAAEFIGVSVSKLFLLAEQRQIAHFSRQNSLYFKKQDLEAYLQKVSGKKASKLLKPPQDEPSMVLGDDDNQLLTLDMAVEYTGINKSSLYSYIKSKKIPYIKKGRKLFLPIVALNQLMVSGNEKLFKTRRKKNG